MSAASRPAEALVRGYQRLFEGRPSPCRYAPSCSMYALVALRRHGLVRGGYLAARRIGRCHPWGDHGHDPVPDTFSFRRTTQRRRTTA